MLYTTNFFIIIIIIIIIIIVVVVVVVVVIGGGCGVVARSGAICLHWSLKLRNSEQCVCGIQRYTHSLHLFVSHTIANSRYRNTAIAELAVLCHTVS